MEGYIEISANAQLIRKRLLLEVTLDPDGTPVVLRYVEPPTPVHADDVDLDGHRWTPYAFRPPTGLSSQAGDLSGVTDIEIPVNSTLHGALLDRTIRGSIVRIYEAYFDPLTFTQLALETELLNEGRLDEPTYNRDRLTLSFKIDAAFDLRSIFVPRRTFTRQCQFIYKGPGCQGVGASATCNHAYTASGGCKDTNVNNQARFGGFLSAVKAA